MPLRLESSCASSKMRRLASVATRASCCSGVPSPSPLVERLRGDPRRDLARLRAAHPVRHRVHRRAGEVGVLVRVALAPGIRARRLLDDPQHSGPPTRPAVAAGRQVIHCRTGTRCRRSGRSPGRRSCWVLDPLPVHVGAVGRAHVLDVDEAVAVVQARVPARRVRVVDRHLARERPADHEARPDPERVARWQAAAPLDDQPAASTAARPRRAPSPPNPDGSVAGRRRSRSALRATHSRNR